MRIISKFKDYYDSIQAYGQDDRVLYVRKTEEFNYYKEYQKVDEIFSWKYKSKEMLPLEDIVVDDFKIHSFLIGFCGKIYPCLKIVDYNYLKREFGHYSNYKEEDIKKISYAFSIEDLVKIYEDKKLNIKKSSIMKKGWSKTVIDLNRLKVFLKKDHNDRKYTDVFMEYQIPCFSIIYTGENKYSHDRKKGTKLIINPCLQEYGFQRVIDPYTAHQEIDMYISGVLGVGEPDIVNLTEKDKLEKRGFDKWSFRKLPSKKK